MEGEHRADMLAKFARAISVLETDASTARVLSSFAAAGIEAILLKGPAHQLWLYGREVERAYGDTDLLVAPDRFGAARNLLEREGFEVMLDDSDTPGWEQHGHHWGRRQDGAVIDLHRTLFGARAAPGAVWAALRERTEPLAIGEAEALVLDEPGRAMHVAIHAAQHPRVMVEHTRSDLGRALEIVDERTWREALTLAREIDAEAAFVAGLRHDPTGSELAARLGLGTADAKDREIELQLLGAPAGAHGVEAIAAASGPREKLGLATRKLFPTPRLMRAWSPLARRNRLGLALAYLGRPLWVLARLPAGLRARRKLDS